MWGRSLDDVYLAGNGGVILHSTNRGVSWGRADVPEDVYDVRGSASGDVIAVGRLGSIWRGTDGGAAWTPWASGATQHLKSVWKGVAGEAFVVGTQGTILHTTDGSTFSAQTSGTTEDLDGVWGSGPDDVYAVGTNGVLLHLP